MATERTTTASNSGRVGEIDALRGLAALGVLLFHLTTEFDRIADGHPTPPLLSFPLGSLGVQLFFMISGFVITLTISRRMAVADFLYGRFARLFPAYWAAVLMSYALIRLSGVLADRPGAVSDLLANLTMCQTAMGVENLDGSYWTLYVELQFYMVVALLLLLRQGTRLVVWLTAVVALDVLLTVFDLWEQIPGIWRLRNGMPLLKHLPLFLYGIWVYEVRNRASVWFVPCCVLCGAGVLVHGTEGPRLLIVGLLAALFAAAAWGRASWLNHASVRFLGTISYSLYLVHQNLGFAVIRTAEALHVGTNAAILLAILVTVASATLLTFCVERPAHAALRKLRGRAHAKPTEEIVATAAVSSVAE